MDLLLGTILLRPYVFAFLAVYLLGASLQFGYRVALSFVPLGYLVALASEYSSIHWGFPYGDYFYIPETVDRELWVLGVPFMDSLSYVFLAACSYASALFVLTPFQRLWPLSEGRACVTHGPAVPSASPVPVREGRRRFNGALVLVEGTQTRQGWAPWLLGAMLMVLLDIVIDPVALQGDRWFLGRIYGYRHPGAYFGIPMSNFYGWLLVALVMIRVLQWLVARLGTFPRTAALARKVLASVWGPVLYVCILLFNLAVTFAIGEVSLGIASSFITLALLVMGCAVLYYKRRYPEADSRAEESDPT